MEAAEIKLIAEIDQRSRSNTKRLDRLEARQNDLEMLTQAVAVVQTKQEQIETDVGEIKTDVKALREKPGRWWEALLLSVLTAAVGYVLAVLTRGGV